MEKKGQFWEMENLPRIKMDKKPYREISKPLNSMVPLPLLPARLEFYLLPL